MKITDVIFALVTGRMVGFLIGDFLEEWGIHLGLYYIILLWIVLPFVSLLCLFVASLIGRKWLFIFQIAKFLLVGAFATIIDLKLFEWLVWLFPIYLLAKSISFILSTLLKYWGNKYWTFQKPEKDNIRKEMGHFFMITLAGLIIDVAVFYYATVIVGPQFGFSVVIWTKLAVIFAALVAAIFNFIGYKFIVFKKETWKIM